MQCAAVKFYPYFSFVDIFWSFVIIDSIPETWKTIRVTADLQSEIGL